MMLFVAHPNKSCPLSNDNIKEYAVPIEDSIEIYEGLIQYYKEKLNSAPNNTISIMYQRKIDKWESTLQKVLHLILEINMRECNDCFV